MSNVNTAEQIVISGSNIAVARALDMCATRGAKKVIPTKEKSNKKAIFILHCSGSGYIP